MTPFGRFIVALIIIGALGGIVLAHIIHQVPSTTTTTIQTYGMSEYTDAPYGFSFWYPSSLSVTVSTVNSTTNFPGGIDVQRIDIGSQGGVYISVVQSASSTITDEPNGHAAPIAQTKYFYDIATKRWMVAYPEGTNTGTHEATTTADTSAMTIAGLPMLPSGARFDTTIIPLSTTEFLVVQDGGGSSFTHELAATVSPLYANIAPSVLSHALQAESAAGK